MGTALAIDERVRVYHRIHERQTLNCIEEVHQQGGEHLMVGSRICGKGKIQLLVLRVHMSFLRYVDEVLRPVAVSFIEQQPREPFCRNIMHDLTQLG